MRPPRLAQWRCCGEETENALGACAFMWAMRIYEQLTVMDFGSYTPYALRLYALVLAANDGDDPHICVP